MSLYINGDQLVTLDKLYSILGITNLLTDDEMNIANAIKSDAAQNAITNVSYQNGVSKFHYCGVADYERVNWKLSVEPNTNYKVIVNINTTNQLQPLGTENPFSPWGINSSANVIDNLDSYDLATWHLPAPWLGTQHGELSFNSGNRTEVYLIANFGYLQDAVPTDMTLQIQMFSANSLQEQISQLKTDLNNVKTTGADIHFENKLYSLNTSSDGRSIQISAPTVDKYKFGFWLQPSSIGTVDASYIADPSSSSTTIWSVNPLDKSSSGAFSVTAVYFKN